MKRMTPTLTAVVAAPVALAGQATAQPSPGGGAGAGMHPTDPGAQPWAVQQDMDRDRDRDRLLEQGRMKEGGT